MPSLPAILSKTFPYGGGSLTEQTKRLRMLIEQEYTGKATKRKVLGVSNPFILIILYL